MILNVSDICEQVRITLDQNQVEESIIAADEATLELDDIIMQKILQAARQILLEAPLHWIDTTKSFDDNDVVIGSTDTAGEIVIDCPDDFLRLSIAKVSDWKIPVRVAVTDLDEEYLKAKSSFAGIRPNCTRPMVAITGKSAGSKIEFLGSSSPGKSLTLGEYVAVPEFVQSSVSTLALPPSVEIVDPLPEGGEVSEEEQATTATVLEFPEKLETALYYLTAAYVALTYKDQSAQSLFAVARSFMGIPEQPQQQVKK